MQRLLDGLRKAGVPVLPFHDWDSPDRLSGQEIRSTRRRRQLDRGGNRLPLADTQRPRMTSDWIERAVFFQTTQSVLKIGWGNGEDVRGHRLQDVEGLVNVA